MMPSHDALAIQLRQRGRRMRTLKSSQPSTVMPIPSYSLHHLSSPHLPIIRGEPAAHSSSRIWFPSSAITFPPPYGASTVNKLATREEHRGGRDDARYAASGNCDVGRGVDL